MKFLSLLFLTLLTFSSFAQDPLRTITTEYTKIHFHQDYSEFAHEVALKIDPIFQQVSQRIGYKGEHKVDVLISDKYHQANGSAIPLTAGPLINIYTSSPRSEQLLGYYSNWLDLVLSHELAHHIHLIEPSRSWRSMFDKYSLEADIANLSRYPRWATEGYATVIETEYTQQGRVNSDYVQALLAQWAIEGQLPSYGSLNGNSRYQGNRMAYMQGSAFLVWLQKKFSKENQEISPLAQLWRRSTATQYRNFDKAFSGLFLEKPEVLYKAFVAEQTYLAKKGQALSTSGKLWQKNTEQVLSIASSPNNQFILQLETDKKNGQQLNVYSLGENTKAKAKFIKKQTKLLKADPLDVADTEPLIFNRKAKYTLTPEKHKPWAHARWFDDSHILVLQKMQQSNLELGYELAKINIESGKVSVITDGARLHDFALLPDKLSVLAVRHFAGFNQLVKVSLLDGRYQSLSSKKLNQPIDNLALSADGKKVAMMVADQQGWQIYLHDLITSRWEKIELPLSGNYRSHLRWQDNWLYFSHSKHKAYNAEVNAYRLNMQSFALEQLTQGHKLVTQAFEMKNELFYLVTTSQGQSTYHQNLVSIEQQPFEKLAVLTAVKSPLFFEAAKPDIATNVNPAEQAYATGPQSYTTAIVAGFISDDDTGAEFVLRGGDPLGRLRWQGAINSSDLQQNSAMNIKGHWQGSDWQGSDWQRFHWYGEWANNDFDADYFQRESKALNAEIGYQYPFFDHMRLSLELGLGREELSNQQVSDTIDAVRLQGQFDYQNTYKKFSYGINADAALLDYQGEQNSWQRNDYAIEANLGYKKLSLIMQYRDFSLDDDAPTHALLTYGGQVSSAASGVKNATILDSRLPLAWQSGHQFQQQSMSFGSRDTKLFYLQHQSDEQQTLAVYGIEMTSKVEGFSPLLDGLSINAGLSWYENVDDSASAHKSEDHQFYFAISYLFK